VRRRLEKARPGRRAKMLFYRRVDDICFGFFLVRWMVDAPDGGGDKVEKAI
jgi:hypothetical protein